MKARTFATALGLIGSGLLLLGVASAPSQEPPDQPPAAASDTEALARGPVHEAYAEPVDYKPEGGPVIKKQPPDPIEEQPPDQKPDGADVRWLPGYWSWDDEGQDYLWVSGFWRDIPPGQRWVPGAWQEVEGGWQWSPGFWTSDQAEQVNYVPTPPPTIDAGPSVPAPQETDVYVPGCWVWGGARFLWRPGFWVASNPDWVWAPARYVWTPGGCVFVDGFWDHPLERRGLLFAPVRVLRRNLADWVYTPNFVVRSDFLMTALFVGPGRHNYCFGDYFTDAYQKRGFVAWFDYHPTRRSYDAIYDHYRAENHGAPAWDRNLRELYHGRYNGDVPRPPHTIVEQQKVIQNITVNKTNNVNVIKNVNITKVQNVSVLAPLKEMHNVKMTNLAGLAPEAKARPAHEIKLQQIDKQQIAREKEHVQQVHQVGQSRREVESKLVAGGTVHVKPGEGTQGVKLALPKAPPRVERPKTAPPPTTLPKPPAPPAPPKHEERPIPPHQPPPPPKPPQQVNKPPVPPKKEPPPPPKKEDKPPVPPKNEAPPPPPKKENPPPPKKEDKPPVPPKKESPPPPPPKKEDKPPVPPKKEDKPPEPPKHEAPPPQHTAPPQHVAPPPQPPAPPKHVAPPPAPPKKEDKPHSAARIG
jgi:hypothetical protein